MTLKSISRQQYIPQHWPEHFFAALENPALASEWHAAGKANIATCLAAYRNNTRGGRLRALEITYPVVQQLLGLEAFAAFSERYVDHYPAVAADLDRFGEAFGLYLQQAGLDDYPYIAAMAELEWLIQDVRQQALVASLSAAFLQQLEEMALAELKVQSVPSVRLLQSGFNLHQLWRWHQQPEGETELIAGDYRVALNMRWSGQGWYLNLAEVSAEQALILKRLTSPRPLTEVLERFAEHSDDLSQELNHWLEQGWLQVVNHDQ